MKARKRKNNNFRDDMHGQTKQSFMAALNLYGPSQVVAGAESLSEKFNKTNQHSEELRLEGATSKFNKCSQFVSTCVADDKDDSDNSESLDSQSAHDFKNDFNEMDSESCNTVEDTLDVDASNDNDKVLLLDTNMKAQSHSPNEEPGPSGGTTNGNFIDQGYIYSRPTELGQRLAVTTDLTEANLKAARSLRNLLRSRTSFYLPRDDNNDEGFLQNANTRKVGQPSNSSCRFFQQEKTYVETTKAIRKWSTKFKQEYKDNPEQFQWNRFVEYLKSSIRQQMKKEYFSYVMMPRQEYDVETSSQNNYLYKRLVKLSKGHPFLKTYSEIQMKDMLLDSGYSCLEDLYRLNELQSNLMNLVKDWREEINTALNKYLVLMNKLRSLESSIETEDKNLDELCYSGKKKLHSIFSTPYFKLSSQDYTILVSPEADMENIYVDAVYGGSAQKWTARDFASLRSAIRDMIVGREYSHLAQRRNYLISRIAHRSYEEGNEARNLASSTSRVNNKKRVAKKKAITSIKRKFDVIINGSPNEVIKCCAIYTASSTQTQEWFQQQENYLRRVTYKTLVEQEKVQEKEIDWYHVASQVTAETAKERSAMDCRLVWLNEGNWNPKLSHRPWSKTEISKLMKLGNDRNISWDEICTKFVNRTTYDCFFKYTNNIVLKETMKWTSNKEERVRELILQEGPKWGRAVEATLDLRAFQHQVQDRWKKSINPMIRRGAFTRVEDALLLLTMDKLRGFVEQELNFRIFMAYLPWRCETVWRDRANCLFSDLIIPWTIDEDKKLMELAERQGDRNDWHKISEQFTSCKNRKNCFTRYNILKKKIGPGQKQFANVEEYHEAYSMTRYNVFQHKHLKEVVEILKRIRVTKLPNVPFTGLRANKPPSELELRWMLLDFDRQTMELTIKNLQCYMQSRSSHWKEWIDENCVRKKTFDRRTFHREDPKSIASVIHIRGLSLVPQEQVEGLPLNPFESAVYYHYARFRRTKALNEKTERPNLPSAKKLSKLPEIRRIVRFLSEQGDTSSGSDWQDVSVFRPKKRGRPRKISSPINLCKLAKIRKTKKFSSEQAGTSLGSCVQDMNEFSPKKRGRPRKISSPINLCKLAKIRKTKKFSSEQAGTSLGSCVQDINEFSPKKRGRPKKISNAKTLCKLAKIRRTEGFSSEHPETSSGSCFQDINSFTLKQRGGPRKIVTAKTPGEAKTRTPEKYLSEHTGKNSDRCFQDINSFTPKQRGRPRKIVTSKNPGKAKTRITEKYSSQQTGRSSGSCLQDINSSNPKKRGRPRKILSAKSLCKLAEIRPPRRFSSEQGGLNSGNCLQDINACSPKKRGRPRKISYFDATKSRHVGEVSSLASSGRKLKNLRGTKDNGTKSSSTVHAENSLPSETKLPKKRGRPRKIS